MNYVRELPVFADDVCHRCEQRPATDDGILCSECRQAELEAAS